MVGRPNGFIALIGYRFRQYPIFLADSGLNRTMIRKVYLRSLTAFLPCFCEGSEKFPDNVFQQIAYEQEIASKSGQGQKEGRTPAGVVNKKSQEEWEKEVDLLLRDEEE